MIFFIYKTFDIMPIFVEFFSIILWTYKFWLNNKFVLQECLCLPIWRVSYA
jgi:hypothetical protein